MSCAFAGTSEDHALIHSEPVTLRSTGKAPEDTASSSLNDCMPDEADIVGELRPSRKGRYHFKAGAVIVDVALVELVVVCSGEDPGKEGTSLQQASCCVIGRVMAARKVEGPKGRTKES